MDPLTKSYPMLTPYQYASNTPIQAIDLDGLEAVRYPGVGTTTEMLQKPTEQEVKEVYRAYRGIALGVYDFFNVFRPQAAMGPGDPNYIPFYSEVKDAYRGISNTIENGSTEDRFRLGTVGALSIYGGIKPGGVGKINWLDDTGKIKWPTDDGFAGTPANVTLNPGARIDRYGYEGGSFVSPEGVPYNARSLAPGTEFKPYNVYEVVKPIDALGGKVAPWLDEAGGGIQYKLNQPIDKLLEGGYIKKVE